MLHLETLVSGSERDIYILVRDGRSPVMGYILGLQKDAKRALFVTLQRMAETGWAGHDENKVKHLKGSRVACEVKEHKSNTRLFFFLHGRRLVVCTHGGPKPGRREYQSHIHRVEESYDLCLREGVLR